MSEVGKWCRRSLFSNDCGWVVGEVVGILAGVDSYVPLGDMCV